MSAPAPSASECAHLLEFKKFLASKATQAEAATSEDCTKNCVTRTRIHNDTYRVTLEERRAELVASIWQYLKLQCPRVFRLKLLQRATVELEKDLKECEVSGLGGGDAPQYDLLKMQKYVGNQMDKLLIKLTDNAELERLKDLADEGALCEQPEKCMCGLPPGEEEELQHTAAAAKNKPRKMEDRHVCLEHYGAMYDLPHKESRFFGVFDGHSGSLSACYGMSQLPQLLADQLKKEQQPEDADFYRNAFETAFLQADERFAQKRIISGTTSVCALINRDQLYIAWVGDSKALLVGKRTQLQLVKPHKPESMDERRRIEAAGSTVIHVQGQWRVNGILNVARSIGDYCLEAVIAEPDFVDVPLSEAHDFLVLGTDGLWDHVPESHIIDTVYECLAQPQTKLDDIPKLLIEAAKERDSQDNITVVIVLLKPRKQIDNG